MAIYSLKTVQNIPTTLEKAWQFFSAPSNLADITPSHLGFKVLSLYHGESMYPGQIIEYTVKPILGIPLYWMTEITHVEKHRFFVDEQRYGPYKMWHHQHHFKEVPGGVEMTDIVHYKIPLGFLGSIAHALMVEGQLKKIFSFRFEKTEVLFGKWPAGQVVDLVFNKS